MSSGATKAFLIAGPVTTTLAMAAVWGVIRPRVFALYVGVGLGGAMLLGLLPMPCSDRDHKKEGDL